MKSRLEFIGGILRELHGAAAAQVLNPYIEVVSIGGTIGRECQKLSIRRKSRIGAEARVRRYAPEQRRSNFDEFGARK